MRRHESPDPETGRSIVIQEDESLGHLEARLECAYSDEPVARIMQQIVGADLRLAIRCVKGHPRHHLTFVVSPCDFDEVVAMVEDDSIEPFTDAEMASEIMRATRKNN